MFVHDIRLKNPMYITLSYQPNNKILFYHIHPQSFCIMNCIVINCAINHTTLKCVIIVNYHLKLRGAIIHFTKNTFTYQLFLIYTLRDPTCNPRTEVTRIKGTQEGHRRKLPLLKVNTLHGRIQTNPHLFTCSDKPLGCGQLIEDMQIIQTSPL